MAIYITAQRYYCYTKLLYDYVKIFLTLKLIVDFREIMFSMEIARADRVPLSRFNLLYIASKYTLV